VQPIFTPNRIVFATDFSPASNSAAHVANRVARIFQVPVTLLHIFQYAPRHRYLGPVEWMVEIIRRDVRDKLEEAKDIFHRSGVKVDVMVREDGSPAQEILAFLREFRAPLLVMGTHANAGMDRFILGSTAEEALRQAPCPVITVGPQTISDSDSLFRRILFATDFGQASLQAAPFAATLARISGAALRVLHVATGPSRSDGQSAGLFDPIRNIIREHGSETCTSTTEYLVLHGDNVSQAIVNEAERFPADLIVLGVHRASVFAAHAGPKLAFQVIAAAPCAVLTIAS